MKTFKTNRCPYLKEVLFYKGWREAEYDATADFTLWDVYDAKGIVIKSKISIFLVLGQIDFFF